MGNRPPQSSTRPSDRSRIEFHRGEVLMKLAAEYRRLPQTILECVQNGFDAGADRILVFVDMKRRKVSVLDNGTGTDRSKFEQALASVGHSVKDAGSLGRFGLGLISPLSKCEYFTFTSVPVHRRKPTRWTFRATDIRKQRLSMDIPWEELNRMPRLPHNFQSYVSGEFAVEYRTMVQMHEVVLDRAISEIDLDELAYDIRTKFMAPMRERKALVRVVYYDVNERLQTQDIDALQFTGEQLPVVVYESQDSAGRVEFELYRARRVGGQRQGKVSVTTMANDTPLTWKQFIAQMRGKYGSTFSDAIQALGSGYFEGIIRCENVALATSRTKFELGDPLDDLYLTLDQWFGEYGHALFSSEEDQSRQARWQESALKVLNRLHARLHSPEFSPLWQSLRDAVDLGRLGNGHLDPQQGKLDGNDSDPSTRVGQGGAGKQRKSSKGGGVETPRQRPPQDRPKDMPFTASGPRGNKRRLVKGDSQGLQIDYAELPGDSRLWGFDFADGTVTFNTLHPTWVRLDETNGKHLAKNAKWILHLQEWLILEVLHLVLKHPERDEFEQRRDTVDDKVKHYVDLFIVDSRK